MLRENKHRNYSNKLPLPYMHSRIIKFQRFTVKSLKKVVHLYPEKHPAHGDPVLAMAGQMLFVQHAVAYWSDTKLNHQSEEEKNVFGISDW